ncbi:hypothetical protein SAMN05421543_10550 [Alicyclobacillus macrosporangiidus]|uniref:Uncharacterized protein n=1 Tax=Alicyclobacillus macrosporangiidus TaxID=392015 RepID=A0A1I7HR56_9BACL|nr:hypothetical protein SAMN05421543_10550 [Alicyclobacillus macrosporangiidus]
MARVNDAQRAANRGFKPASLRPDLVERIREWERQLSAETAGEIVLVAYDHENRNRT